MSRIFTKTAIAQMVIIACAVGLISPALNAGELELPAAPLVTTKSVKPNMMLLLDSSGSMNHIVPDGGGYDESVTYYNCPQNKTLTNTSNIITISITASSGQTSFKQNGNTYSFGDSGNNRCFDTTSTYNARLYANTNSGNNTFVPSSYGNGGFSGNYLNWYLSNSARTGAAIFEIGERKKTGTKTRMEVTREAATLLVSDLENIRLGLSKFNSDSGVKVINNIADIDTQRDLLETNISEINADGYTPLGEALQGLGRYFTRGGSGNLILHPDSDSSSDHSAADIFKNTLSYKSPTTAPAEVITNWCQQSFVVSMTDGLPTKDNNISSYLKNYLNTDDKYPDDVVKAMYEMDLRPDLKNGASIVKNNITTYVVGFADDSLINDPFMATMAEAGGGGGLLTASNGEELASAFETATNSIFAKVAAGSGTAFNTSQFSADSSVYAASFNSAKWSGNLKAFELSGTGEVSLTASWDAAAKLDAIDYTTRNIFTYNPAQKKGVIFDVSNLSNLSSTLLADLQAGPKGSSEVSSLINYLKGDRSNEGNGTTDYRTRTSTLGDIANSTVVYVGAPQLNWPAFDSSASVKFGSSGKSYSTFKSDEKERAPMLYVGANDGMLHGFSAADGEEEIAYIPNIIASSEDEKGLHYLAQNDYAHQFYVDLTPTVSDVYIDSAWRTVLIGGLRSGGKGLFALDITDPSKFSSSSTNAESLALWEFSSSDDSGFGYNFSKPTVAMMANGEWAVIVGNGYNSGGNAKLFIIYLDKNGSDTWTLGGNYQVIDTGVLGGLATPRAVDLDGDSVVDRIYAGDLLGNMWAFDVSGNINQWAVANTDRGKPQPLFSAKDSSNKVQAITTAPILAKNLNSSENDPNVIVFFGTGKYLEESDKTSAQTMSYYGVLDDGNGGKIRSDLTERKLITSSDKRVISGANIDWANTEGWYFDFLNRSTASASGTAVGERIISNSLIRNGILLFPTVIPNVANSDICVSNSESWLMAVDLNTGKAPIYSVFDINSDGSMNDGDTTEAYDSNGDGVIDAEDRVSYGGTKLSGSMVAGDIAILGDNVYSNDVDGVLIKEDVYIEGTEKQGRLSWEELIKY